MSAMEYVRLLRRGWKAALLCVVATTALGVLLVATSTRQYRADTHLFVAATSTAQDANQLALANTYVQARVQSYPSIATSPMVTKAVVRQLHLPLTPSQLASRITASAPAGTVLMTVSVLDPKPAQAARVADAVAARFAVVVAQIERTDAVRVAPVKLTITAPAQVPTAPASPNATLDVGFALVVGLALGIGVAVVRGTLDTSIDGADALASISGAPVLAVIPRDKAATAQPLAVTSGSSGGRAEAYRQLRTNLQFVSVDQPPKVIAVTSAVPGEGKTSTALNLAAALAEAGAKVVLVEADLRRPTIAATLGLVGEVGLTAVLVGTAELADAVQFVGPRLGVLTSGSIPPNPSELLDSAQARRVFALIAESADYTIIDTAPLLPVTDGAEVAARADATLLVGRAGRTTHQQITAAVDALAKVDVRAVGTILSMAPPA